MCVKAENTFWQYSVSEQSVTGRGKCVRKRCARIRDDRSLEMTVKKSRFKNLRQLHKKWNEGGVAAIRARDVSKKWATTVTFQIPSYSWTRDHVRNSLAGLQRKRARLLLSGPKSFFFRKKLNLWRFGMPCHLLGVVEVDPVCLSSLKSMQQLIRRFYSTTDKLYGDDFISQQDLMLFYSTKCATTQFAEIITVLVWPFYLQI